jgi:hypothetical protein
MTEKDSLPEPRNPEDFRREEFTELRGVGDCYGDSIRIFFAFSDRLIINDDIVRGFLFVADPQFLDDGEMNNWNYCLRIQADSLEDIFARMSEAVAKKAQDRARTPNVGAYAGFRWEPISKQLYDSLSGEELRNNTAYRLVGTRWHQKVPVIGYWSDGYLWEKLNPEMLDPFSNAELSGNPEQYRRFGGEWHVKTLAAPDSYEASND